MARMVFAFRSSSASLQNRHDPADRHGDLDNRRIAVPEVVVIRFGLLVAILKVSKSFPLVGGRPRDGLSPRLENRIRPPHFSMR